MQFGKHFIAEQNIQICNKSFPRNEPFLSTAIKLAELKIIIIKSYFLSGIALVVK